MRQQAQDYRPAGCVHSGRGDLWGHGCYYRKADRSPAGAFNPVAVPRFLCPGCKHTCPRLPACVAPRRWFIEAEVRRGRLRRSRDVEPS